MNRPDQATELFRKGFNCAQAVFLPYADQLGMDRDTALKISCPFGAGMSRAAETCGAVTGALMAIGLRHGRCLLEDEAARETTYALSRELMRRFPERHGSLICRDLLGCDIGTPEGQDASRQKGAHTLICPAFVTDAARILDGITDW